MQALLSKVTNWVGLGLLIAVLFLGVAFKVQTDRLAKVETANVTLSSDVKALKVRTDALEKVRKVQGVKYDKLSAATAANPVWADDAVPDDIADSLRTHADAKHGTAR